MPTAPHAAAAPRSDQDEDEEQRVTNLELFFDLVFVFAVTQVSGFVDADPTWTRLLEGLAILAVLWWAWVAFAWLANSAGSDEGVVRLVLLGTMAPLLVASLAVPAAFGANALLFGCAYFVVRATHLVAYLVIAREDPALHRVVGRLATTILPAAGLLVLAGVLGGTARDLCWLLALAIDYGGMALRGVEDWRVEPAHFAERHGGFVIIALGESIVGVGIGAERETLTTGAVVAALLGITGVAALWWAYFDVIALAGRQRLERAAPGEQERLARDSYTYLHLPIVAGVVLFAVGLKEAVRADGDELATISGVALCGGVALYLLALSAFRRRNYGGFNRQRLVVVVVLVAFAPLAHHMPATAALGVVTALLVALVVYEVAHFAEGRDRFRHPERA